MNDVWFWCLMINNLSTKKVVSRKTVFCRSVWSKARGLMFTKKSDKALVFIFDKEKPISLHMFFVFYPIDVLFLDGKKRVVQLKEYFKPWHITFCKSAQYVIELPVGTIERTKTNVGDSVRF